MLSISDIANIKKPLVWTLHDMWAFSGTEHYPDNGEWKSGYFSRDEKFNFDAWVWGRKLKHWRRPIQLVSPSNWLKNCIQSSRLMGDWNVEVIGNPIDTGMWYPENMNQAREALGIPLEDDVILFGAVNGGRDLRKGFDLLIQAIQYLKSSNRWPNIRLIIFGENKPEIEIDYGFPTHYFGHITNEGMLRTLYSASDLFIAPSRQEVFGQTATEAHACGCPVLAFDGTGLSDIIEHLKTGYLAQPFLVSSLVEGIEWIFSEKKISNLVFQRLAAREKVIKNFSYEVIGEKYKRLYEHTIRPLEGK
jgi:glycosyltransferase involved in cell wall biosynthesis